MSDRIDHGGLLTASILGIIAGAAMLYGSLGVTSLWAIVLLVTPGAFFLTAGIIGGITAIIVRLP